jgi:hypothetical protein
MSQSVINYCILKQTKNLNHDFEYRMIAKMVQLFLAEDIVTIVLKMISPSACAEL